MQVKRQRISFFSVVFIWITLFGIQTLVLELAKENSEAMSILRIIFPIALLGTLIGLVIANKYLVKDDMISITNRDYLVSKITGYIAAIPMIVLILFDFIVKNQPQLTLIVKLVASSLLIAVGVFGTIYFLVVAFKKPKSPFDNSSKVIDAEFEEKKPNLPN